MQKHLKKFNNLSDYETFKESDDFVLPNISYIESNNEITYSELKEGHKNEYLTFEALEDGTYTFYPDYGVPNIQYSIDGGQTWVTLNKNEYTPVIHAGDEILWKNSIDENSAYEEGIGRFAVETKVNVKGNIMSLLYGDEFEDKITITNYGAFLGLFMFCEILNAKYLELPATTLTEYCYYSMFEECYSLVTAPELPATTLAKKCYQYMFSYCSSLVTAPSILPATTLANNCYQNMFYGCESLEAAPELPATTLAYSCYDSMFDGCKFIPNFKNIDFYDEDTVSIGALIGLFAGTRITDYDLAKILPKNAEGKYYLPSTVLSEYCYYNMFRGCRLLTTAPELPATTLADNCYDSMFSRCTSLITAPKLPATTLAYQCYDNMFADCTSLTTAPELPATTLAKYCYNEMFYGCESLEAAPELPATTLSDSCYTYMFNGCTSLVTAPSILPATSLLDYCYYSMFNGCESLITAPKLPATTLASHCYTYMFEGCHKLNNITMLATDISSRYCLEGWVNGVAKHGTFTKNKDASWANTGWDGVPSGWYVLTQ